MSAPAFDAIVLAGGAGSRLGRDKPEVRVGGVRLLDRVLDAVADARQRIVVGPSRTLPPDVVQVREQPPGGGPVAGIAAGMALVTAPLVVILAADLPFVTASVVAGLVAAVGGDGAVLVDDEGRDQVLAGAWRTAAVRSALTAIGDPAGVAVRRLVGGLDVRRVRPEGSTPPWWDIDTPDDLSRAEERA